VETDEEPYEARWRVRRILPQDVREAIVQALADALVADHRLRECASNECRPHVVGQEGNGLRRRFPVSRRKRVRSAARRPPGSMTIIGRESARKP
jgi:hypothetical protein